MLADSGWMGNGPHTYVTCLLLVRRLASVQGKGNLQVHDPGGKRSGCIRFRKGMPLKTNYKGQTFSSLAEILREGECAGNARYFFHPSAMHALLWRSCLSALTPPEFSPHQSRSLGGRYKNLQRERRRPPLDEKHAERKKSRRQKRVRAIGSYLQVGQIRPISMLSSCRTHLPPLANIRRTFTNLQIRVVNFLFCDFPGEKYSEYREINCISGGI